MWELWRGRERESDRRERGFTTGSQSPGRQDGEYERANTGDTPCTQHWLQRGVASLVGVALHLGDV